MVAENRMFEEDTMSYASPLAPLESPSSSLEEELYRAVGSNSRSSSKLEEGNRRTAVVEEYVVEEYAVEEEDVMPTEDTVVAPLIIEEDFVAEPVMVVQVESEPKPVQSESVVATPQERKRGIFGSLIRRAEPSKMDGTVLAFNLL